jgi:hypothetical protein
MSSPPPSSTECTCSEPSWALTGSSGPGRLGLRLIDFRGSASARLLSLSRARAHLLLCLDSIRVNAIAAAVAKSRSTRPQLFAEAGPQLRRGSGSPNLPAKTFLGRSLAKALCVWGENSKSLSHPPSWCKLNRLL